MKTAIQQMMTELNELHPNLLDVYTSGGRNFVNTCHKYLAVEKEQIIEGYGYGHNDGCRYMNNEKPEFIHAEDYYEKTYGGNK
jgi:hypothetical protein